MKATCSFVAIITAAALLTNVAPGLLTAAELVHAKDGSGVVGYKDTSAVSRARNDPLAEKRQVTSERLSCSARR